MIYTDLYVDKTRIFIFYEDERKSCRPFGSMDTREPSVIVDERLVKTTHLCIFYHEIYIQLRQDVQEDLPK